MLASLLVTAGGFGILGEVVVRYRETHRSSVPGTMPLIYYRHAQLGYELVHDYDYFGWVQINSHGFRGDEISVKKAANTFRIMTVGASTTFDKAVTGNDRTWPARLEHHLNDSGAGVTFEVINAGVDGYRLMDSVIRLETKLFAYAPDLVILYHAHNDLFAALRSGRVDQPVGVSGPGQHRPDEVRPSTRLAQWLGSHSLFYRKVKGRFGAISFRRSGGEGQAWSDPDSIIALGTSGWSRDMGAFLAVAQSMDFEVLVPQPVFATVGFGAAIDSVTVASWRRSVPFAEPHTVTRGYKSFSDAADSLANRFENTMYVRTDAFDLAHPEWYAEQDPIHFNDRGAERMAEALSKTVLTHPALIRFAKDR